MLVALTGTPGVGKTTLAGLAQAQGWRIVDVKQWAAEVGAIVGHDAADEADVVDVRKLAKLVKPVAGRTVYEGHLSHLLPVDVAWVVRCDPRVLAVRLRARGYPNAKVRENLEAEALDIVLQEALGRVPHVIQRDGTRRTPFELFKAFADASRDSSKGHDLEAVDWSDQLPIHLEANRGP